MKYEKFQEYERRAYSTVYSEEEGGFHDGIIRELANHFLPTMGLNTESRILDIGCGPGVFMEAARDIGYNNVVGVTLSAEDHRVCQDKGFNTVNSSMNDLEVDDNSVDFIWCRHALEHSPFPLFTLYEFHRVLKESAMMFIEVPAPDNERAFMHEFNPNHYSILGQRMWHGLFDKSGFDIVGDFLYDIDIPYRDGKVNEKSYIFTVRRSQEDLSEKFFRKYGIRPE